MVSYGVMLQLNYLSLAIIFEKFSFLGRELYNCNEAIQQIYGNSNFSSKCHRNYSSCSEDMKTYFSKTLQRN